MEKSPAFIAELRTTLLDLHKSLMDAQRVRYEREHGRIQTPNEFLGLLLEHPSFAWLRSLSALIAQLDEWIEEVATSVAYSIVAAIAVIDVETVIIDGAFPVTVRHSIIERTRAALSRVNQQGLSGFKLVEGSIGNAARAMGGASLPLLANFTQDREVLFKDFEATR